MCLWCKLFSTPKDQISIARWKYRIINSKRGLLWYSYYWAHCMETRAILMGTGQDFLFQYKISCWNGVNSDICCPTLIRKVLSSNRIDHFSRLSCHFYNLPTHYPFFNLPNFTHMARPPAPRCWMASPLSCQDSHPVLNFAIWLEKFWILVQQPWKMPNLQ